MANLSLVHWKVTCFSQLTVNRVFFFLNLKILLGFVLVPYINFVWNNMRTLSNLSSCFSNLGICLQLQCI